MALLKTHETLATDAEVWRYYEIDERVKLKLYKDEPLPTEPLFIHNGCPRTELTVRMESFMSWNGHEKDSFRQRVKQELPELELTFQRISQEEIPKIKKAFNEAETLEFRSILRDNRKGRCFSHGFTTVKTGLPVIMPLALSQSSLEVPVYWDVKKRERFIDYVKRNYPVYEEKCKVFLDKSCIRQKMDKFKKRLAKEQKKEQEEAEYQAYKLIHTVVQNHIPTAVPLGASPVVEARWA